MTDATKPAGDLVRSLRSLGADFRSHPVANGTIERTEEAGELMHEAADEIDRLTAALADRERAIAEAVAAERKVWEESVTQVWRTVDPFRTAGEPGSYARGMDNGIASALTAVRANVLAIRARSGAKG